MPVSVPCHREHDSCGSGSRTSASERMKLGRAPAHPQSQAPVSSRADRPHESQPGTCLAWEVSITIDQSPGGDSNSHASGARASEARASAIPPPGESSSGPCGNRTRLPSLRGWCPVPIDERTFIENCQWVAKELNLSPSASPLDGNGFTGRREEHHPREPSSSSTGGSRTHRIPGFEPGRFAGLRTVPSLPSAPPTGFEPAISTVTEWRALQAAPRRRNRWLRRDSNPQHLSF